MPVLKPVTLPLGGGPGRGCCLAPLGQEGVALLFGVGDWWHLIIFGQQGLGREKAGHGYRCTEASVRVV